jgi:DNA-binding transcriptional LysR family regulator
MGRIAADLFAAWPDIQLDVTADDRLRESDKETFDVVICVDPPSSDWVGRRLMSDHMRIVAAPSLPRPVAAEAGAPIEVPAVVTPAFDKAALWQVHDDGDRQRPTAGASPGPEVAPGLVPHGARRGLRGHGRGDAPLLDDHPRRGRGAPRGLGPGRRP